MRFATFERAGVIRAGVVSGDRIFPVPGETTVLEMLRHGNLAEYGTAALSTSEGVLLAEARLHAPLQPPAIRDFVAFEAHIEGVSKALDGLESVPDSWYGAPAFYFTNPHSVTGPHDDVEIPPRCAVLDFEFEIAAVMGVSGRDLTPAQAREAIAGYLIFNDWSARDLQRPEKALGLGFAKGKDFANTLGPWLVTADELEPYRDADGFLDLTLTLELNGQVLGKDSLASMSWTFEEMAAYASRGAWLRPGDVLGSGTCGTGCLAEIWGRAGRREPGPLAPGDVVTMTAEGIGTISNRVVAGASTVVPVPTARKRHRGPRH